MIKVNVKNTDKIEDQLKKIRESLFPEKKQEIIDVFYSLDGVYRPLDNVLSVNDLKDFPEEETLTNEDFAKSVANVLKTMDNWEFNTSTSSNVQNDAFKIFEDEIENEIRKSFNVSWRLFYGRDWGKDDSNPTTFTTGS